MKLYRNLDSRTLQRVIWNSQAHKDKLAPYIQAINVEWERVELETVLQGVRPVTQIPLRKDKYLEYLAWAVSNGIKVRVVRTVKAWQGFANSYEDGDDYVVTAFSKDSGLLETPTANLGYPECCQKFFAAVFPTVTDPIWQWAVGPNKPESNEVQVLASPYSDPTLRYWNIRFCPHLPCNPMCPASIELGSKFAAIMKPELRTVIYDLLAAPHSWDCYRSLAIIKTEPFRMVVGSVPAAERYVVNVVSH